jgi:hypothetical protein
MGPEVCEHRHMLPDAGDRILTTRAAGLRCPRCGIAFALVVGKVGPCEPCQLEIVAEAEARREARAIERPCAAGCGRTVTGSAIYCSGTCRSRAHRRRRRTGTAA